MKFTVTKKKDRVAKDTAPAAYYYIEGTIRSAWEPEQFYWSEEWLREQQRAPEAEAEAAAEKKRAADHPSGEKETEAEKGHASHGSGRWTQKL